MSFRQLGVQRDSARLGMPIALWSLRAPDVTKRFGISFIEADRDDGLGRFLCAVIESEDKKRFGLVDHLHAPTPGTEICTHEASTTLSSDLALFVASLGIRNEELIWIHPDAHDQKEEEA